MRARAAAVLLAGLATATGGCGTSGDCTEKATCPDPGDGAAGADVPVGADGGHPGEAGPDGTGGSDSGSADSSSDGSSSDGVSTSDSATCSGVCADAVPAGWSGPVTLFNQTGSTAPTPPACPTSFPTDAYDGNAGLSAAAPTCGCTCSAGTGAECGSSGIEFYQDPSCQQACNSGSYSLPPGLCVTTGCPGGMPVNGVVLTAPTIAYAGSCTPQPTSSIPPASWSTTARACGTTPIAGTCPGGGLCVPAPPSPFSGVCIYQAGTSTCPSGSYSVGSTFYGGVSDSRACTSCSCGTPSGASCTGAGVQLFTQNTGVCGGTAPTVPFISGCQALGGNAIHTAGEQETTAPTANNGTCTATGGQASGTATPATPTTVCCTP